MENLISLTTSRLHNLELVQFARDTVNDTTGTKVSLLTSDVPFANYLKTLQSDADKMEIAIRNPQKNPLTEQLLEKDRIRDMALSRFGRKLAYYELSDKGAEQKAFSTLNALWNVHRDASRLNYQAQTSDTDNLLVDLAKEPFATALTAVDLQAEIDAVRTTNDAYRALSSEKRAGLAEKDYQSATELRTSLTKTLSAFANYVDSLTVAYANNAEWSKVVKAVNVVRQRYADLLARRSSATKPETTDVASTQSATNG